MRVLLLASHAVAEYDDLRMFTDMGFDCFAPGGYEVPSRSGEGIRPALPDAPHHPELVARLNEVRAAHMSPPGPFIDWGKAQLHDDIIDWADVIIVHHFPRVWIGGQWDRIRGKRVIWRTCGQSDPGLEADMMRYRDAGMQVVRYSPAEKRYFESAGAFAGQDALIRFGKYPEDYGPWTGDWLVGNNDLGPVVGTADVLAGHGIHHGKPFVANVTQDMVNRGDSCGLTFWRNATEGLPAAPAGQGSAQLPGGLGPLSYPLMLKYLAGSRAYLYTGTTPASYTLGLIEAMLSGVPIVSVGPDAWAGPDRLFEGWSLSALFSNDPQRVREHLAQLLVDRDYAAGLGVECREKALETFDIAEVSDQWREFLS